MKVKTEQVSLPYIDNTRTILITLGINLGVVFLVNWPEGITFTGVIWDSLFCVIITTIIDMWIVYARLQKVRAWGGMPSQVPVSRLMQRLPRNPFALGAVYVVFFGALTIGINADILWFFDMWEMNFVQWMVYKLVYATVLSVKITEYSIFRYVQPDWAKAVPRDTEMHKGLPAQPVKDPLPKVGVFKEMFGSVTGNIAMNIIIGSVLRGIVLQADGSVVIAPTTVEGIPITGLIFGLITGILVTNGVVKEMNAGILASCPEVPETAVTDKRFAWMPVGRVALTCFVCVCMMAFSAAALWSIMMLLNIAVMNFYQFTVFITVYASILGKPLACALTRRCVQPDYIRYTLRALTPAIGPPVSQSCPE